MSDLLSEDNAIQGGNTLNSVGTNKRLESIRFLVQEMIIAIDSAEQRQEACVQLYGVSNFASLLAKKRGLNQEIAAIIGLLHDYYFFKTGIKEFPGLTAQKRQDLY
ncbi:hypothetical protein [Paenibacillus marinisediminis]